MKRLFATVSLGLVILGAGGVIYYVNQQSIKQGNIFLPTHKKQVSDRQTVISPETETRAATGDLPEQVTSDQGESEEQLRELNEQAIAIRHELDNLIAEYDRHLKEPEVRKQLKERISSKTAEYNQYVLPVAVNQMENKHEIGSRTMVNR